ncbi:NAD(P)H-hydrate epimerase [Corynebacterium sp. 320]|uniref:bifunctional ADP-dependent NAD(P)H-hydrate dehydratase/NAD(P)H-hydrate epimerase n=1 Tax=Corynebacterium TaxID=1716 RepID=UPI00125CB6F2|nr:MULTISPECIES: bifunctional ADP-dependent NAD(P)H-hydrate dehydratase/NAD(P)H-hydrate epimerase [Corynebacterium]KAB1504041.1 NAD(P)H-hydrate epimerase [Corynebacterium sp. 320]KAB1552860.1 NAD(P)H-hydrate epimerase [Corynebacterium sp. 321]KAB1553922.1 NAD(P)H-hydrate epimerase [Corynebacterium sp. 319]KAB3528177.1 NAD(P)H-hydrate epimerase [Corynebacterium sp. 250]KAB3540335.1 NAD(P)H-hydrate epimerase [Corynebacterium sp. 366]
MMYLYTAQQVRDAEWPLLNEQAEPDELMRLAAARVADVARVMLAEDRPLIAESDDVLLLVGPGGNGGDALYAGAELLGVRNVHAVLVADMQEPADHEPDREPAHAPAREAFTDAGGVVLQEIPLPHDYRLIIDGISGLGSGRPLDEPIAELLSDAHSSRIPILSIDLPSGVAADTGQVPDPVIVHARGFDALDAQWAVQRVPAHVQATVTVTFGGLRRAHGLAQHECGQIVLVDLGFSRPVRPLSEELWAQQVAGQEALSFIQLPSDTPYRFDFSSVPGILSNNAPQSDLEMDSLRAVIASEPSPRAHKYSGGVVTVCAGSDKYPGAGQLCAISAMKATSYGVRFVGDSVSTNNLPPEILRVTDMVHRFRSHAYAVGPGRGVEQRSILELSSVLSTPDPVVIDADAISILAQEEDIRTQVRDREGLTVLTPHEGEFLRLAKILGEGEGFLEDRVGATVKMASELQCYVILKGRASVIATPGGSVTVVDAGSSWAATPGSGDVLTGILGAYIAQVPGIVKDLQDIFPELEDVEATQDVQFMQHIVAAVIVHCTAARCGARTEFGSAPVSASGIVNAIPAATALLGQPRHC